MKIIFLFIHFRGLEANKRGFAGENQIIAFSFKEKSENCSSGVSA